MKSVLFICLSMAALLAAPSYAQSGIALSGALLEEDAPISVTADDLIIDEREASARFLGNAKIVQAGVTIEAQEISVFYGDTKNDIKSVVAEGDVRFDNGTEIIESQTALYDGATEILTMSQDVIFLQKDLRISANRLVLFIATNKAEFYGSVKTEFTSQN